MQYGLGHERYLNVNMRAHARGSMYDPSTEQVRHKIGSRLICLGMKYLYISLV